MTLAAAALLALSLDGAVRPAAAAGEKSSALLDKGRDIFQNAGGVGCAACHGQYAEGDVGIGPYLRGMNVDAIRAAINSVAEMEFLRDEMTAPRIQQIASFTEWLGQHQLVKTLAKRGRFIPNHVAVRPGTPIQFIVDNASRFPRTFVSDDMGIGELKVAGRESSEIIWTAPRTEGAFTLRCADCRIKGQNLTIQVSKAAPPFMAASSATTEVASAPPSADQHDTALIEQGREIFLNAGEVGCTACHGNYAEGDVGIGPNNRGFDEAAIRKALKTVEAMKFLGEELSDRQIVQVAAYYKWLGELQLVKTRSIRDRFFPEKVRVAPGAKIQLVVSNGNHAPGAFASTDMAIEPFTVPGLETADLVWQAPRKEGTFTLSCVNCANKRSEFRIEVTGSAAR